MYLIQTFVLTLMLDTEKFNKLKSRFRSDKGKNGSGSLVSEGITATFHDKQYKKKVVLSVTPQWLMDGDEADHPTVIRKTEEYIVDNFGSRYQLNDFKISGMLLITNIDVHEREKVVDYLKVLQRIGRVKGFSPLSDDRIDDDISFCLAGNSNGIEFRTYDLERLLKQQLHTTDSGRKQLKKILKKSEGLLRSEVRLTEAKAIRAYTDETDTAKQMIELSKRSEKMFLDTFMRVIPFGDYFKKDEAVEIVVSKVQDMPLRRRMLHLLDLVPEKKSLHLAQKALNYRRVDLVMDMFADIEVAPVAISKRHDVKRLDNLYKYM